MPRKSSVEGRGLLQAEEFDIDELDYLDHTNGHARTSSKDYSRSPRSRFSRSSRSKYICILLTVLILFLIAGGALKKGGHLKVPELPNKWRPFKGSTDTSFERPAYAEKPDVSEQATAGDDYETIDRPHRPDRPIHPKPSIAPTEAVEEDTIATSTSVASTAATDGGKELEEEEVEPESSAAADTHKISSSNDDKNVSTSTETHITPLGSGSGKSNSGATNSDKKWTKPKGFKIIGLIFFGRPDTVSILDCYLRKNLVRNGGWLDEVHFVINTNKTDDIEWLNTILPEVKEYKKVEMKSKDFTIQKEGYNGGWETCNDKDLYIKVDDDIVFFDDNAIPNIVYTLMKHPEALNVVSTLINSPETGWLHYRLGAIHAYLPERSRSKERLNDFESYGPRAWRASSLPTWEGKEMSFPVHGVGSGKEDSYTRLPEDNPGAPPFKGHRWLPLPNGDKDLWATPFTNTRYDADGPDWSSWSLGAQAHYSFLQNLENDTLNVYHFGSGLDPEHEGIWNMVYERMNINFMAIWGKDVKENLPFDSVDDELALSVQIPTKLRRRECSQPQCESFADVCAMQLWL